MERPSSPATDHEAELTSAAEQLAAVDTAGGWKGRVHGLPSCATIEGELPEPLGSIAQGRWAHRLHTPKGIKDV